MELNKHSNYEQHPSLSNDAYIRSLTSHLTIRNTSNPTDTFIMMNNENFVFSNMSTVFTNSRILRNNNHSRVYRAQKDYMKQIRRRRRRFPTTKPYQEKILNLAEARKEISNALKLHRAAMKDGSQQRKLQRQQRSEPFNETGCVQDDEEFMPMILSSSTVLPSCINNFTTNIIDGFSPSPSSLLPMVPNPCTFPFHSPVSPFLPPPAPPLPLMIENFNFPLPNHNLEWNLGSVHDFNYLDDILFLDNNNSSVNSHLFTYSSSSPSSSSVPLFAIVDQEVPSVPKQDPEVSSNSIIESVEVVAKTQVGKLNLHAAIDDEVMEEIRLIGEQYQKEWDDTDKNGYAKYSDKVTCGCCPIFLLTAAPSLPCPGAAEAHCKRKRELQRPLFLTHSSVATSRVVGKTFNESSS
ncbi:hypothetical protein PIB30_019470 [Stylosanthes scabra]|uniref:Uncharacterized protein n=1 Tax=Stylosanthes scabra TaxID=79078 RepID=A0ABU6T828_9FABA|nr:hypothetical protein [Stylosanthes scabra]